MKKGLIYVCVNLHNGKKYIGQTTQRFDIRKAKHIDDAFNRNSNTYFHKALRAGMKEDFIWNIIEDNIDIDELNDKEKHYIKRYKANDSAYGYNLTDGGERTVYSKLSQNDVDDIKNKLKHSNISMRSIAKEYDVSHSIISGINNGENWFDDKDLYPLRISNNSSKLNEEDILSIYQLLKDGVSYTDIAKRYGCTTTNISNINFGISNKILDDSEYPICSKKFSHLSQEEVNNIVDLLKNTNLSHQKIADTLNISRKVITNINNGKNKKIIGITEFPIRK